MRSVRAGVIVAMVLALLPAAARADFKGTPGKIAVVDSDGDLQVIDPTGRQPTVTLDTGVDGYAPVVAGLNNDIDEIETQVFDGDPAVSRRIYELSREVIEFQRATRPLLGIRNNAKRLRRSNSTAPPPMAARPRDSRIACRC